MGDLLKGIIGDALMERIKEIIRKQVLKTAAKAGIAAVADGPLPIGDIVAAGLSIYDGINLTIEVVNMKEMSSGAMRSICEALADQMNCLAQPKCCDEVAKLLRSKVGGMGDLLSRKKRGVFTEQIGSLQREIRQVLKDCCVCRPKQGHHSDMKYLGGDPKQDLTQMIPERHGAKFGSGGLHGAFDAQNPGMARSVGGKQAMGAGGRPATLAAQENFYDQNYKDYPDAACDFILNTRRSIR
jgi:hypothetical protein